jgi:hypothetical protein
MFEPSFQHPTAETWTRAGLLTTVSVMIGLMNQAIISSFFAHFPFAVLVGFGIGGIISSAIQGAYWRRFIAMRLSWMIVSMLAWILIAVPLLWFPPSLFELWLCDYILRRALIGGLTGGIIGGIQALLFRNHSRIVWGWIAMSIIVWAVLYMLPALLFSNYLLIGEGACLD